MKQDRNRIVKINFLSLWITLLCHLQVHAQLSDNKFKLWYRQPADRWMKHALPIGNGSIGAMIFGGVVTDKIQFNEKTLWTGKENTNDNEALKKNMALIQRLLADGKVEEADSLYNNSRYSEKEITPRENFGAYQPFGNILLQFKNHEGIVKNYRRQLDIAKAVATVSYELNGVKYNRTYFCSYPDKVLVVHLTADKPGKLSVDVSDIMPNTKNAVISIEKNNDIVLQGVMAESGLKFCAKMRVKIGDGKLIRNKQSITVENASQITLELSAATNYQMQWGQTISNVDPAKSCSDYLQRLVHTGYDKLYHKHVKDFSSLFSNVQLNLPVANNRAHLPTDERISLYMNSIRKGGETGGDPGLEELLFHYGRYLMVASSRGNTLPANLQGIWNDSPTPAWDSDYHTDINIEMNYWPIGAANLDACFKPFVEYIKFLQKPGKITAKEYFHSRGVYTSIYSNPWGYAAPRWLWTGSAGWICQNLYDEFSFSGNINYLKNDAFPIMKDACRFYLDNLLRSYDGKLSVVPSNSPEINFVYKDKKNFRYSAGAAIDQQIVFDLFTNTIQAIDVLKVDLSLKDSLNTALKKLADPVKISKDGTIQEWKEDWNAVDPQHRHTSHLYALFPGRIIDPETQPAYAEAAAKTIEKRGKATGWALIWRMLLWARLQNSGKAYDLLKHFINRSTNEGIEYGPGFGGIYDNLFASYPPFQIEANFGYTAAIAEMLLQSQIGNWKEGYEIRLLPALPKAWPDGIVKGLRARGEITVDMEWKTGKLVKVVVSTKRTQNTKISYGGKVVKLKLRKGKPVYLGYDLIPANLVH